MVELMKKAVCTVMLIWQKPTNCVLANNDRPYVLPDINLCPYDETLTRRNSKRIHTTNVRNLTQIFLSEA